MNEATWDDVGTAPDIMDMTGDGTLLHALDSSGQVMSRPPVTIDAEWRNIMALDGATSIALGFLGWQVPTSDSFTVRQAFYAASESNRLLTDICTNLDCSEAWYDIGQANNVVSLSAASEVIYAVNSKGKLWVGRFDSGIAWEYLAPADGIIAISVANNRMYGVTDDGHLWWRAVNTLPLDGRYCDYILGPFFGEYRLDEGCTYHAQASIWVHIGAQLDIPQGVTVEFEQSYSFVLVEGTMNAIGTPNSPVRFTDIASRWAGISLSGTASILENVIIEKVWHYYEDLLPAGAALDVSGTAYMSHVTLQNNDSEVLWIRNLAWDEVIFEDGEISNNDGSIILYGNNNSIRNTRISQNADDYYDLGLIYMSGNSNSFEGNTVTDNGVGYGPESGTILVASGNYNYVSSNVFSNNSLPSDYGEDIGLFCWDDCLLQISGNQFLDTHKNFRTWWSDIGTNCALRDNIFYGGVDLANCDAEFNEFRAQAKIGDSDFDGGNRVRYNSFLNTLEVRGCPTSEESSGISSNNFLSDTATVVTVSDGPGCNINFENNWWNTTDSEEIAAKIFDGADDPNLNTVDYMPFLSAPVIDAGPQ